MFVESLCFCFMTKKHMLIFEIYVSLSFLILCLIIFKFLINMRKLEILDLFFDSHPLLIVSLFTWWTIIFCFFGSVFILFLLKLFDIIQSFEIDSIFRKIFNQSTITLCEYEYKFILKVEMHSLINFIL